jgi:hypothetical protein
MAASVSVSGDDATAAKLHRIGRAARNQAPVMAEAGRKAARGVRVTARDTGALAGSIVVIDSGDWGFVLGSHVPYARYVFKGTRYVDAQPPKLPPSMERDTADALSRSIVRA